MCIWRKRNRVDETVLKEKDRAGGICPPAPGFQEQELLPLIWKVTELGVMTPSGRGPCPLGEPSASLTSQREQFQTREHS